MFGKRKERKHKSTKAQKHKSNAMALLRDVQGSVFMAAQE